MANAPFSLQGKSIPLAGQRASLIPCSKRDGDTESKRTVLPLTHASAESFIDRVNFGNSIPKHRHTRPRAVSGPMKPEVRGKGENARRMFGARLKVGPTWDLPGGAVKAFLPNTPPAFHHF